MLVRSRSNKINPWTLSVLKELLSNNHSDQEIRRDWRGRDAGGKIEEIEIKGLFFFMPNLKKQVDFTQPPSVALLNTYTDFKRGAAKLRCAGRRAARPVLRVCKPEKTCVRSAAKTH